MFKTIISLSVAAMSLCVVSAAHAEELPADSVCHIAAEYAYDVAVASGDGSPDGAYEHAMGSCEDIEGTEPATLNELIATEGEVVFPVCEYVGNCVAR